MEMEMKFHFEHGEKDKLMFLNGHSNNDFNSKLESKLLRDGLISDVDNYSFEMKRNKLKINGKKQSKSVLNEYLDFYKNHKGKSFDKKSKYSIQKSE